LWIRVLISWIDIAHSLFASDLGGSDKSFNLKKKGDPNGSPFVNVSNSKIRMRS
jgi:hypothetical protein